MAKEPSGLSIRHVIVPVDEVGVKVVGVSVGDDGAMVGA
jgi:hypothetical protein